MSYGTHCADCYYCYFDDPVCNDCLAGSHMEPCSYYEEEDYDISDEED